MNMKHEEYKQYEELKVKLERQKEKEGESMDMGRRLSQEGRPTVHSRRGGSIVEEGRNMGRFVLMSETEQNETVSSISLSGKQVPEEYEKLIQKLEADVRGHIRVEQQLKLHIESVSQQLEDNIKELKQQV